MIANKVMYGNFEDEFLMKYKEFKTYVNDLLYKTGDVLAGVDDQICMFQKPYEKCGSTTLLMDYLKNRMIYEENYEAIVIVKDNDELAILRNIIAKLEHVIYDEVTHTASNPNMNNIIHTTHVSSVGTYSIQPTELIILDYEDDSYNKGHLDSIFSLLNNAKEKTRLIVEYAPE